MNISLSHNDSNMMQSTAAAQGEAGRAPQRRRGIRTMLMMISTLLIVAPLPLIGVMGYLVADGNAMAAFHTALAAVSLCVCAIVTYVGTRVI